MLGGNRQSLRVSKLQVFVLTFGVFPNLLSFVRFTLHRRP